MHAVRRIFSPTSRSLYPVRACHFCSIESIIAPPHPSLHDSHPSSSSPSSSTSSNGLQQISTGSVDSWYCSSCQCWNRVDPTQVGGMATWEQGMGDEKCNVTNMQRRASRPASTSLFASSRSSFPATSPFCHSCQTNQTLILSIMANNTKVGEMDDDAVEEWKASLESRYPPVCVQCQGMVTDRIERADKMARGLIWNGWLNKSRTLASSSPQHQHQQAVKRKGEHDRPGAQVEEVGLAWTMQGLAFLFGVAISIAIPLLPFDYAATNQIVVYAALTASHLLSSQWDPTAPRQARLKRRLSPNLCIKVHGLNRFSATQTTLFAVRSLHLLVTPLSHFLYHPALSIGTIAAVISTLAQCLLLWDAAVSLQVEEPPSISLKTKQIHSKLNNTNGNPTHPPAFGLLSLDFSTPLPSQIEAASVASPQSNERGGEEQDMDWSPTLAPSASTSEIRDDFQLGPQRFFEPVRKTGLEELLDRHLALDSAKETSAAQLGKTTGRTTGLACSSLLALLTLLAALLAAAIAAVGPTQAKATLLSSFGIHTPWPWQTSSM